METDRFNYLISIMQTDTNAFNEIYNEYFVKVVKHAAAKFRGQNLDADDLAQSTFWKLVHSKPKVYIRNPTAWLYVICDRIAFSMLKKYGPPTEMLTEDIPDNSDTYLNNVLEMSEANEKLSKLSEEDREILYLRHLDGYSLLEISKMKHISYVSIRQKYSRAIKFLRNL